ncbi:MAG: hypothetical protein WCW87_03975 [Candidatus Paceibacterota bacterium]
MKKIIVQYILDLIYLFTQLIDFCYQTLILILCLIGFIPGKIINFFCKCILKKDIYKYDPELPFEAKRFVEVEEYIYTKIGINTLLIFCIWYFFDPILGLGLRLFLSLISIAFFYHCFSRVFGLMEHALYKIECFLFDCSLFLNEKFLDTDSE